MRACDHDAHLPVYAESHRHERYFPPSPGGAHERRPSPYVISQALIEPLMDFSRLRCQNTRFSCQELLNDAVFDSFDHPRIDEIEAQHPKNGTEQRSNDVGRLAGRPDGGKRDHADQIVNACLEAYHLRMRRSTLCVQRCSRPVPNLLDFRAARVVAAGIDPAVRKTGFPEGCHR
jgi:hypothetical protein